MSADPRAALNVLVTAFERHLEACSGGHGDDDPSVIAAYEDLIDAFEAYDGALYDATGEMTPFDIYGPDEDDDEGDDDENDEDDDLDRLDGLGDHDDEDGDDQLYGDDEDVEYDDRR